MEKGDFGKYGDRHVSEARGVGKNLLERALRVRCLAYLSEVKSALLTDTIYEMKESKETLSTEISRRREAEEKLQLFNKELEKCVAQRTAKLVKEIESRKRTEEKIVKSLREKEALLKEVYHRTKNNMQVICAMLNLQLSYIDDEKTYAVFKDMENRILSMAKVHEKLYQSRNLSEVALDNFIKELANKLLDTYRTGNDNISLKLDLDKVGLTFDLAVPCALVMSELITNALKHGFPNNKKGELKITLKKGVDDEIIITISDNGVGVPDNFDIKKVNSFGLDIITSITEKQLEGKLEFRKNKGTEFIVRFKEKKYAERIQDCA